MADPRVFFAAERTLLEWIRTSLIIMGFGFVVARFGLLWSANYEPWIGDVFRTASGL